MTPTTDPRRLTLVRAGSVGIVGFILLLVFLPAIDDVLLGGATPGHGPSMAHGSFRMPDVLDDGDYYSLERTISHPEDVITTVEARQLGHIVARDYGDLVLFESRNATGDFPDDVPDWTLHRAIVWVEYNDSSGLFDVPSLGLRNASELIVPDIGHWEPFRQSYERGVMQLLLARRFENATYYDAGNHSGFVTKGDHNPGLDETIVRIEWIEGKVVKIIDREEFEAARAVVIAAYAGLVGVLALVAWRNT